LIFLHASVKRAAAQAQGLGGWLGTLPNARRSANPVFAGTVTAGGFAGSGSGSTGLNASFLNIGTLPTAPAIGDTWRVSGIGLGGWKTAQNAGQSVVTAVETIWMPHASQRSWSCVASSADGSKLVAVEYQGQVYISTPSSPSGTAGSLFGSQNAAIELIYIGNGQFIPLSQTGTIY
jgi:hypothetical protein